MEDRGEAQIVSVQADPARPQPKNGKSLLTYTHLFLNGDKTLCEIM